MTIISHYIVLIGLYLCLDFVNAKLNKNRFVSYKMNQAMRRVFMNPRYFSALDFLEQSYSEFEKLFRLSNEDYTNGITSVLLKFILFYFFFYILTFVVQFKYFMITNKKQIHFFSDI